MHGTRPPVTDDDLHGFVDGETDSARSPAIVAHLAVSPADAAKVECWRRQNDALRAAFARVADEPLPLSLALLAQGRARQGVFGKNQPEPSSGLDELSGHSRGTSLRVRASAPIVLAFLGGAASALAFIGAFAALGIAEWSRPAQHAEAPVPRDPRGDASFVDRTLSALSSFGHGSDRAVARAPASDKGVVADLEGSAFVVPNLSRAGLRLTGVAPAPPASGRSFCIFYATPAESTVALCVEKAPIDASTGFRKDGDGPARAVSWRQKGANYALAGALSEAELGRLAETAHAEIEAFDTR